MKAKVRLSYSVELYVEAENFDALQDWLNQTTPDEAKELVRNTTGNYIQENFDEEIMFMMSKNADVDYVIPKTKGE